MTNFSCSLAIFVAILAGSDGDSVDQMIAVGPSSSFEIGSMREPLIAMRTRVFLRTWYLQFPLRNSSRTAVTVGTSSPRYSARTMLWTFCQELLISPTACSFCVLSMLLARFRRDELGRVDLDARAVGRRDRHRLHVRALRRRGLELEEEL